MLTKTLSFRWLPAICAFALIIGTVVAACRKTGITIPPSLATFVNQSSGSYFITGATVTDTIPVGVTTVSPNNRTIAINVSSPSGAVSGTQYTLASNTVTIPAGQTMGYIVVKGIYNYYNGTTRKDTLVFTIANGGEIPPSDFNDTFTLLMRGPCVEGKDFIPAEFVGTYNHCIDVQGGDTSSPYTIIITSSISTGPTSANLVIQNLGGPTFLPASTDPAFSPGTTIALDWSDPSNLKATVPDQLYETTYFVANLTGSPGNFSSCHQIFTLNYDVIIPAFLFDSGLFTTMIVP